MLGGCWQPPEPTEEQFERGLAYMIPGFQGDAAAMYFPLWGLRDGGVDCAVRVVSFGRPFLTMGNLTDYEGNRKIAIQLAKQVTEDYRAHPGIRIDLLGYSGGGAIALWIAEALPPDVRLRHILLIQPAVSTTYDLTPALKAVDGYVYHLSSDWDWIVLGLATRVFGTMERKYEISAGKVGFDIEAAVPSRELRAKLREIPWRPFMMTYGHFGDHTGVLIYPWNRRFVAPLLLEPQPASSAEVTAGIKRGKHAE